jgi:hypothetical protein
VIDFGLCVADSRAFQNDGMAADVDLLTGVARTVEFRGERGPSRYRLIVTGVPGQIGSKCADSPVRARSARHDSGETKDDGVSGVPVSDRAVHVVRRDADCQRLSDARGVPARTSLDLRVSFCPFVTWSNWPSSRTGRGCFTTTMRSLVDVGADGSALQAFAGVVQEKYLSSADPFAVRSKWQQRRDHAPTLRGAGKFVTSGLTVGEWRRGHRQECGPSAGSSVSSWPSGASESSQADAIMAAA